MRGKDALLIYFTLPGLLLGGYITKYAIDLNIEERSKEIGLLRTKAAKRRQIALAITVENSLISTAGMILGIICEKSHLKILKLFSLSNGNG